MHQAAAAKDNAGSGADSGFEKITTSGHDAVLPEFSFVFLSSG
jgi:hypothetical protein